MQHLTDRVASHPDEDTLELYCLGRLNEESAGQVEEHLLLCDACRDRASSLEQFLYAMRAAASDLRRENAAKPVSRGNAWFWPSWAAAGALAAALVVNVPSLQTAKDPQTVELSAFRGVETISASAKASQPLELRVDLTGLDAARCRFLSIVAEDGSVVTRESWNGSQGPALLRQQAGLASGQYWVRVESPEGELLRESGLKVQ